MDGKANITLTCDKEMERFEFFNISLTLTSTNPLVAIGNNTSTVQINDIIGKQGYHYYMMKKYAMLNSELQPVIIWSNGKW